MITESSNVIVSVVCGVIHLPACFFKRERTDQSMQIDDRRCCTLLLSLLLLLLFCVSLLLLLLLLLLINPLLLLLLLVCYASGSIRSKHNCR